MPNPNDNNAEKKAEQATGPQETFQVGDEVIHTANTSWFSSGPDDFSDLTEEELNGPISQPPTPEKKPEKKPEAVKPAEAPVETEEERARREEQRKKLEEEAEAFYDKLKQEKAAKQPHQAEAQPHQAEAQPHQPEPQPEQAVQELDELSIFAEDRSLEAVFLRTHFSRNEKVPRDLTAVNSDGRMFHGPLAILYYLKNERSKLYIYKDGAEYPHLVSPNFEENAPLIISEEEIAPQPESVPDPENPEKSITREPTLKAAELVSLPTKEELIEYMRLERKDDDADRLLRHSKATREKQIQKVRDKPEQLFKVRLEKLNRDRVAQGKQPLVEPKKPTPPNPPEEFTMTAGDTVKRALLKVVTLGFGETEKGRQLKEHRKEVEEWNAKKRDFPKKQEEYRKRKQEYLDGTKELREQLKKDQENAEKRLKADNAYLEGDARDFISFKNKLDKQYEKAYDYLREFHSRLEVRLQGVKDLDENGVTADNLFAHVWLLGGKLEEKEFDSETINQPGQQELKEDIAKYLMASHLEKTMMSRLRNTLQDRQATKYTDDDRIESGLFSEEQARKAIKRLDDPAALQQFMESAAFKATLTGLGRGKLYASSVSSKYEAKLEEQTAEKGKFKTQYERLMEVKSSLVTAFGKQTFSKVNATLLAEVARMNVLDDKIKWAKGQRNRAATKESDKITSELINDLNNPRLFSINPFHRMKANPRSLSKSNVEPFMTDSYVEALQALRTGPNKDKELSLPQMQQALNQKAREIKLEKQEQREAQSGGPSL